MTKRELIHTLAARTFLSKEECKKGVDIILDTISSALIMGRRVELRTFGVFETKVAPSREGRNPRTGESVHIEETRKILFKPCNKIFTLLNTGMKPPTHAWGRSKDVQTVIPSFITHLPSLIKKGLLKELSSGMSFSLIEATLFYDAFLSLFYEGLSIDRKVSFLRFGAFDVQHTKERRSWDFRTKTPIVASARNVVKFHPSDELIQSVRKEHKIRCYG